MIFLYFYKADQKTLKMTTKNLTKNALGRIASKEELIFIAKIIATAKHEYLGNESSLTITNEQGEFTFIKFTSNHNLFERIAESENLGFDAERKKKIFGEIMELALKSFSNYLIYQYNESK